VSSKKLIIAVIPARYTSGRLQGKMLLDLGGQTIVERTYRQACKAKLVDEVWIATDDERIFAHAQSFGAKVAMTGDQHQSGTDRIAELAAQKANWDIVVNVQGDEPFIDPADIDKAVEPFKYDPLVQMVSLYHEIVCDPSQDDYEDNLQQISNPNNVKVVTDINDNALLFSRALIPHVRDKYPDPTGLYSSVNEDSEQANNAEISQMRKSNSIVYKKHIGLYAYRRDILLCLTGLQVSELEKLEKLEQLRALENQIPIKMIKTDNLSIGIDTEEDYKQASRLLATNYLIS
jgi:3-deoxy-manno-octulosonate cytidylyltransferase (CMP-KDO synthetase)